MSTHGQTMTQIMNTHKHARTLLLFCLRIWSLFMSLQSLFAFVAVSFLSLWFLCVSLCLLCCFFFVGLFTPLCDRLRMFIKLYFSLRLFCGSMPHRVVRGSKFLLWSYYVPLQLFYFVSIEQMCLFLRLLYTTFWSLSVSLCRFFMSFGYFQFLFLASVVSLCGHFVFFCSHYVSPWTPES